MALVWILAIALGLGLVYVLIALLIQYVLAAFGVAGTYSLAQTAIALEEEAREKGCYVVQPGECELFIDIDSEEAMSQFERLYATLSEQPDLLAGFSIGESPSGKPGHYHVHVRTRRPVEALERILLQAVLGSDPMRELLSYRRLISGAELSAVSVFFEKPKVPVQEST